MAGFGSKSFSLSIAEWAGIASFLTALLLLCLDTRLSVIPLVGFLLLCAVAPFFPRFSFYLPTITRGKSGEKAVALTFDDGPDPKTTPELLRLLQKHGVAATFCHRKTSEHSDRKKSWCRASLEIIHTPMIIYFLRAIFDKRIESTKIPW
jgi:hypothetical protein